MATQIQTSEPAMVLLRTRKSVAIAMVKQMPPYAMSAVTGHLRDGATRSALAALPVDGDAVT